jgi:hypothetical protein
MSSDCDCFHLIDPSLPSLFSPYACIVSLLVTCFVQIVSKVLLADKDANAEADTGKLAFYDKYIAVSAAPAF